MWTAGQPESVGSRLTPLDAQLVREVRRQVDALIERSQHEAAHLPAQSARVLLCVTYPGLDPFCQVVSAHHEIEREDLSVVVRFIDVRHHSTSPT